MIAVEKYIALNHVMITNEYKYLNVNKSSTDEYQGLDMEKREIFFFLILYVKYFLTFYKKKSSLSTLLLSPQCTTKPHWLFRLRQKFTVHTFEILVMMS